MFGSGLHWVFLHPFRHKYPLQIPKRPQTNEIEIEIAIEIVEKKEGKLVAKPAI